MSLPRVDGTGTLNVVDKSHLFYPLRERVMFYSIRQWLMGAFVGVISVFVLIFGVLFALTSIRQYLRLSRM